MEAKVSVIVPVYNSEKFISKCLESIIRQTYKNIEILIINDGSSDESETIINVYRKIDHRITYYYQNNSGPSKARNRGILNATGEYVIFLDSDDTVHENYVMYLLNEMINSNSDLVCCGYKDISRYGMLNCSDFNFESSISINSFMKMVCKGTGGVLWGKIYKREIITKFNLKMDEKIFMCEDLVFVLQYASQCKKFKYVEAYLYNYNRLNQYSISKNISIHYMQNYILVCKRIEEIFKSVELDENEIHGIITRRIQDNVLNLIEQQSINIKSIGIKASVLNVKKILSMKYVRKYINSFSSDTKVYQIYIYIIRSRFIMLSIIYGIYLNGLRKIKGKLRGGDK
ncbi:MULTISPECIES: glycosyltransferase family 2 protein [Bacillus]|uniref:Glycosyl transferase n=2 Tax=Bacillus cereus group TaxID=86661 RepID=A0A0J1KVL1_BACAN|nr:MULTISPECIES: glycosyltransferase family 2 protein [Bacillus]EDX69330.1 glycosyltransferase [Bacillus cereus NVH0597-99]ARZ63775.1 glycosyl transferase [Bacillus thuringiensis]KLV20745.1 glycosyl transferase [Bacillus anthracis]MDA2041157.1 glycosyltransferase family 2 protein [Bacillus cereus]MDA2472005.1 glycosyltransferase family 2 protein [Bacillus cereus]